MQDEINTFPDTDTRPVRLYAQDEGLFGRIQRVRRCLAPKGVRPTVKRQAVREYTYAYTALCPQNGDTVSLLLPAVNTDMMNRFLRELSAQLHQYRVILLVDQAGWHLSGKLETFDNIRLLPLPAYSPELNPVENFWKYVRDKLGNGFWESMDDLEDRLVDILHDIKFQPDPIQSLSSYPWLFFPF